MLIPTVNYLPVIVREYDASNRYESYRKGYQIGKRKLMKVYPSTNQLTIPSKDDEEAEEN